MLSYAPVADREFPQKLQPSSSAIVVKDGKILVQKRRDNGKWGLPGGIMDVGETIARSCIREVKEETGLDVEIVRLTGIYSDPATQVVAYPDGNVVQHVAASFECRVVGGTLALDHESTDAQWIDPRALPEPFVTSQRVRIEDWLRDSSKPAIG